MNRSRQAAARPNRSRFGAILCCIVLLLGPAWGAVLAADAYDERRVRTGAKLFRALLAADLNLAGKTTAEGQLKVLVFGQGGDTMDEAMALIGVSDGGGSTTLKGMQLLVEPLAGIPDDSTGRTLALFLAEPPDDDILDALIRWGIDQHVIVYSPFEGHVERGVMAGVSIEAKVRPYINQATLRQSQVELKPFFLKVAKVYE